MKELKTKDYIKGASTESVLQPHTPSGTEYHHRPSHQTLMYRSSNQRS
jgi:hypothetical protein